MASLMVIGLIALAAIYTSPSLAQNNVCTVHDFQPITRVGVNKYYYTQTHYARSGWWRRRSYAYYRQNSAYRTITETSLTTTLKHVCCTGYEEIPASPQLNCRPKCDPPCQNGGTCIGPNTCSCITPYIPQDCTSVACNDGHPCFPGLCRRTTAGGLTCNCPQGFSGTNCETNNNGPELDDCYLILKQNNGKDVTVNCKDRSSVFISLAYLRSIEPRVTLEYSGPDYIPHISYITDHWFGLQMCEFELAYNVFATPAVNVPAPPRTNNYTFSTALSLNNALKHGDKITVSVKASTGGYRVVHRIRGAINESFSNGMEQFIFNLTVDHNPPVHCSNVTPACNDSFISVLHDSTPNELNTQLDFPGWSDDVAGVAQFIYEVFEVETNLLLAAAAWNTSHPPAKFHRSPYLSYRVSLTVVDAAGNTRKAPELLIAPRLIATTEKPKDFTPHFTSLVVIVSLLVIGAIAATVFFIYRKVKKQREVQRDFALKLGREMVFQTGERRLNNFADFRLCTVTKGGIEHEGIAKLLAENPSEEDLDIMKRKKEFWESEKLMHPNVIRFYGSLDGPSGPILAFEYCETGSLNQLLREIRTAEVDQEIIERLEHFGTQVALGLTYLHQNGLLHTKLTSRHVILSDRSGARLNNYPHPYCAKIIGFDPSKPRGTKPMRWLAPEVSGEDAHYTYESDVFNFATFLLELFSLGADPWQEYKTHVDAQIAASRGIKPERPEYCSTTIYEEVISPATDLHPELRPTMYEVSRSLDTSVCEGMYGDIYTEGITVDEGDIYYEPGADSKARPDSGIYY